MISCTILYVDPTETLMGQAFAHEKNLQTGQIRGAIALQEYIPPKDRKWFQWLLKFPNRLHSFLPVRRPCINF